MEYSAKITLDLEKATRDLRAFKELLNGSDDAVKKLTVELDKLKNEERELANQLKRLKSEENQNVEAINRATAARTMLNQKIKHYNAILKSAMANQRVENQILKKNVTATNQLTGAYAKNTAATRAMAVAVRAFNHAATLASKVWRILLGAFIVKRVGDMSVAFEMAAEKVHLLSQKIQFFTDDVLAMNIIKSKAMEIGYSIDDMGRIITRFAVTTKNAFSVKEMATWTEALVKSARATGTTTMEMNNALIQLSQAFSAGRLMGDEYRSISENLPMLKIALEEVFKGTTDANVGLKSLSSQGKITSEVLIEAFGKLEGMVEFIPGTVNTIEASFQRFSVAWQSFAASVSDSSVIKDTINSLAILVAHLSGDQAVIMGAAKAFPELNESIEKFSIYIKDAWESLVQWGEEWLRFFGLVDEREGFKELIDDIIGFKDVIILATDVLGELLIMLGQAGSGDTKLDLRGFSFIETFKDAPANTKATLSYLKAEFIHAFKMIGNNFDIFSNDVKKIWKIVGHYLKTVGDDMVGYTKNAFASMYNKIVSILQKLGEKLSSIAKYAKFFAPDSEAIKKMQKWGDALKNIEKMEKTTILTEEQALAIKNKIIVAHQKENTELLAKQVIIKQELAASIEEAAAERDKSEREEKLRRTYNAAVIARNKVYALKEKEVDTENRALKQLEEHNRKLHEQKMATDHVYRANEEYKESMDALWQLFEDTNMSFDEFIRNEKFYQKERDKSLGLDKSIIKTKKDLEKQREKEQALLKKGKFLLQEYDKELHKFQIPSFSADLTDELRMHEALLETIKERYKLKKKSEETEKKYNDEIERANELHEQLVSQKEQLHLQLRANEYDILESAVYQYNTRLIAMNDLLGQGAISSFAYSVRLYELQKSVVAARASMGDFVSILTILGDNFLEGFGENFKSMMKDAFQGSEDFFEDFTQRMTDLFTDMLAEMAYQALLNPIILNIQQSLMGTGFSAAGGGTTSPLTGGTSLASMTQNVGSLSKFAGGLYSVPIYESGGGQFVSNIGPGGTTFNQMPGVNTVTPAFSANPMLTYGGSAFAGNLVANKIGGWEGLAAGTATSVGGIALAGGLTSATGFMSGAMTALAGLTPVGWAALAVSLIMSSGVLGGNSDVTPDLSVWQSKGKESRIIGQDTEEGETDISFQAAGKYGGIGIMTQHDLFKSQEEATEYYEYVSAKLNILDEAIFMAIDDETNSAIEKAMSKTWLDAEKYEDGGFDIEEVLSKRFDRIFDVMNNSLENTYETLRDLGASYEKAATAAIVYEDTTTESQKLLDELWIGHIGFLRDVGQEGEEFTDTAIRVAGQLTVFNDYLKATGDEVLDLTAISADYIDRLSSLAGGFDQLIANTSYFYQNFFSEEEQFELALTQGSNAISDFSEKWGTGFLTKESLVELALAQDLVSDSGIKLYDALMKIAPAVNNFYAAIEAKKSPYENFVEDIVSEEKSTDIEDITEEMIGSYMESMQILLDYVSTDLPTAFEQSNETIWQSYENNLNKMYELGQGFDYSVSSMNEIASSVQYSRELELELLDQIKDMSEEVAAQVADTVKEWKMEDMTSAEKYKFLEEDTIKNYGIMMNAGSPEEAKEAWDNIYDNIGEMKDIYRDREIPELTAELDNDKFIKLIEFGGEQFDNKMDKFESEIEYNSAAITDAIIAAFDVDTFDLAAKTQMGAAIKNEAAAKTMVQAAVMINTSRNNSTTVQSSTRESSEIGWG